MGDSGKKIEWNRESTLKLIELWELYPCLYNTKSPVYHNKHKREEVFQEITKELQEIMPHVQHSDIKAKMTNLRSQYTHQLNKVKSSKKSGCATDDVFEPSVYWFQNMHFLEQYIKARPGVSSVNVVENSNDSFTCNEAIEDVFSNELADHCDDTTFMSSTQVPSKKFRIESSSSSRASTPHPKSQKSKKVLYDDESLFSETSDAIREFTSSLREKSNRGQSRQEMREDIATFGEYVKAELNMVKDEVLLDWAKHEIQNIIYQVKQEQRKCIE